MEDSEAPTISRAAARALPIAAVRASKPTPALQNSLTSYTAQSSRTV